MKSTRLVQVVLFVVGAAACGCGAPEPATAPEGAARSATAPTTSAPQVSVAMEAFTLLTGAVERAAAGEATALPARLELGLDREGGALVLRARAWLTAASPWSRPVALGEWPQASVRSFSAEPAGAAVLAAGADGPSVLVTGAGSVRVDLEAVLTPGEGGVVLLRPLSFPVATLSLPAELGVLVRGGSEVEVDGGRRCYALEPGARLEVVVAPPGSTLAALVPVAVCSVETSFRVAEEGVRFVSAVRCEGGVRGGAVTLELPAGATRVAVREAWATLRQTGDRACVVTVKQIPSMPWHLTLEGWLRVGAPAPLASVSPPAPTTAAPAWRGGLVGVADDGARLAELRAPELFDVPDAPVAEAFVKRLSLDQAPRRLLRYVARAPLLELAVAPQGAAPRPRGRVVARLTAQTARLDTSQTRVELAVAPGRGPLSVALPALARDVRFVVGGAAATPSSGPAGVVTLDLPADAPVTVAVEYQEPATSPGWYGSFAWELPVVDAPVLDAIWTVEVPRLLDAYQAEGTVATTLTPPPFFLARLGRAAVDAARGSFEGLRSSLASLRTRLSAPPEPAPPVVEAAPARPAPEVVVCSAGPRPPGLRPPGAEAATPATTGAAPLEALSPPLRLRLDYVDETLRPLAGMVGLLLGGVAFMYLWLLAHGDRTVDPRAGLAGTFLALWLYAALFPFAGSAMAWPFLVAVAVVALWKSSVVLDQAMVLARLRARAFAETGTIGDLEGHAGGLSARERQNIIPLGELFEESAEGEGIQFLAPAPDKPEKPAKPDKGGAHPKGGGRS